VRVSIAHVDMRFGGVESQLLMLCDGLRRRGHAVEVVLGSAQGQLLRDLGETATVVSLDAAQTRRSLPRVAFSLAQYLRQSAPDAFLSFHPFMHDAACAAHLLARSNTPLILCFPGSVSRGRFDGLRTHLWKRASAAVCVSRAVMQGLVEAGTVHASLLVIENCVDVRRLAEQSRQPVQHPWLADGGHPVAVTVSRLVRSKRVDLLLRAVSHSHGHVPMRLIVLGDGPELGMLECLANDLQVAGSVSFVGYVENPAAIVSRCDSFVFASEYEGLPTVLLEAMACGTAVVAMRSVGGVTDVVTDNETGVLVSSGDYGALAESVARLSRDDRWREGLVQRARKMVRDRYDIASMVDAYESLLASSRTSRTS
jgi:glycosyltransferase involved in cell wall biosynthesis